MAQEPKADDIMRFDESIGLGDRRVTRQAYLKFAKQRALNLMIETAHKTPGFNSLAELRNGLFRVDSLISSAIVAERGKGSTSATDVIEVSQQHLEPFLRHEMELAFRFGWIKEAEKPV